MSITAMKQALEALELMYACYAHSEWISYKQQEEKILAQCVATTMTLRQAIEQAEKQEFGDTSAAYMVGVQDGKKQREWVGLTKDDLREIIIDLKRPEDLYKAIETKLKEKNT